MTAWASLPPELVRQIVHLVIDTDDEESTGKPASGYVTISREWQSYVEERTFSSLRIRSTEVHNLHIVTRPRHLYVRNMTFEVILPEYDIKSTAFYKETREEQQQNNRSFAEAIFRFFDVVGGWNNLPDGALKSSQQRGISLRISASSPSDNEPAQFGTRYYRHRRWEISVLELSPDQARNLPSLPIISEFLCGEAHEFVRKLDPRTCCEMAAKMPNVHTLDWSFSDNERRNLDRRIRMRREFAASLQIIPESVRHLTLGHVGNQTDSHSWDPPRLYQGGAESPDPLSVALQHLSRRLCTLNINNATISQEIFWPTWSPSLRPGECDEFPYLETMMISLTEVTPSGEWLFTGDPIDYDEDPSDSDDSEVVIKPDGDLYWFRTKLDQDHAEHYFLAAARAAQHMPRLKLLTIEWLWTPLPCGMSYKISGNTGHPAALVFWGSPPPEPSRQVVKAWRKVTEILLGSPEMMFLEPRDEGRIWCFS